MFVEQVDWETCYLNKAAQNGAILFWLAKETSHHPERAYAQTTRFELAEWKTKYKQNKINLLVGIEPKFPGERYIRHRFGQDCPEIHIHDSFDGLMNGVCDLYKTIN